MPAVSRQRPSVDLHPRASVLAIAVLAALAGPAAAQSTPAPETAAARKTTGGAADVGSVVVTGQRSSIKRSIATQEAADNVVSAVSSDDIGALPDKNAAEALARVPGVSVQRDQGEGRYVTIRGIGADLNSVTINGALVPAPEAGRRGVALDVLPAGIIRSIEVVKTLTADRDANSIGGTVDVKTLSAFDLPGQFASANIFGTRDQNIGETSPGGGALFATRLMEGKFGIAAGFTAEKREFGSDNVENGGAWTGDTLSGLEFRDYLPVRERGALSVNLDYRPEAGESWYARILGTRFSDDEVRDRLTMSNFAGGGARDGVATTGRLERRLRQRKYTQEIRSLEAGGEKAFGDWKVEGSAGISKAEEDTPEALNDGRFRGASNFTGIGFNGTRVPTFFGPDSAFNAASYNLNAITLQKRLSEDEEKHGRLDFTYQFPLAGSPASVKFGGKVSRREKTNDTDQWAYNSGNASSPNYWGPGPVSMTGFVTGSSVDYRLGNIGPALDPGAIRARVAGLSRDPAKLAAESVINDYTMNEDIDAAYLMGTYHAGDWKLNAGIRNERTKFEARGTQVQGTTFTPNTTSRSYSDWLPSLHARYDLDRNTSLRTAYTSSVVRANFSQLAPGVTLSSPTEATVGNPNLDPLTSRNFDLGIERIIDDDGVLSAYVFTKDIKDFTYQTNLAGTPPWTNYTTVVGFANGDKARVNGIEIAYSQFLRMLPSPFDGILVGANATFTDSTATIARFDRAAGTTRSRDIPLPSASDRVYNLILGYEKGPVSARVALNQKSPYLLQTGSDILNGAQDLYVDTQRQVDLSLTWRLTKQFSVTFEGANLNNEKYYVYQGSSNYGAQYEQYGRTYKLTLKADFF